MKYYRSTLHCDQVRCSADNSLLHSTYLRCLVLLLFPERSAVCLYCDKLKRTSHPKHSFLPTLSPPLFHQPAQRYCIFLSLFYSISFMLCFQNSQPFLGLSFRLLYIMCLCVYYSLISNCLQQCRYILWLYLM